MLGTGSPHGRRILLVDGDPSLTSALCYSLEAAGFEVRATKLGQEACDLIQKFTPDLLLLEVELPDLSGFEVCRRVRARTDAPQPAIVFVTAKSDEATRVASFEVGADDFIAKPYSMSELMLRIQARLPVRARPPAEVAEALPKSEPNQAIVLGPLAIYRTSHRVFLDGQELKLSVQEMRLLSFLASDPGKMRSRRDLLTGVWGYHPNATSRTLDTHIKRLRDKFGALASMIQTIHGVGYRLTSSLGAEARDPATQPKHRRH
jgi:two-component system, OmpR family, phosphate regulon response regulator PhoB